jgi:hypothetical protein
MALMAAGGDSLVLLATGWLLQLQESWSALKEGRWKKMASAIWVPFNRKVKNVPNKSQQASFHIFMAEMESHSSS